MAVNDQNIKKRRKKKKKTGGFSFSSICHLSLGGMDEMFLATVLILTVYGLIMVFSASAPSAFYVHKDSMHFFKSQAMWAGVGIFVMFFVASIDYNFLKKYVFHFYVISMLSLVAVLLVGTRLNGAKRWINLGFSTIQPSEIAKIALVMMCALILSKIDYISWKETKMHLFSCAIVCGIFALLLIFQPHFSAILIVALAIGCMMIAGGIPLRVFTPVAVVGVGAGACLAIFSPYRFERMMSFIDPFKYKMDQGWQVVQSLYAIGSGGFSGLGLGRSRQKYLYIPEPQNDFIFSIICEELGFLGGTLVIVLFIFLLYRGVKIALDAPDRYSMLLVFGLISLTVVQAALNICVASSLVPPTGIPLPFFSAGGTSFVFQMVSMGMILNISSKPKIVLE